MLGSAQMGGRFIVDSGSITMVAVAKLLKAEFGADHKIKTTSAPWFLMKVRAPPQVMMNDCLVCQR
jgi:hypothetical protein